jgi:hypothetical protein
MLADKIRTNKNRPLPHDSSTRITHGSSQVIDWGEFATG